MEIKVVIEGVTPLLVHAFTDSDQLAATSGTRSSAAAGDRGTPQEQAASHLYIGEDGKPMIPQPNLLGCIIAGGSFFKSGKQKITTQRYSLIPACVAIQEITIPIEHKQPWKVDTRPVRIPATGGRILRHRPCFEDWRLSFTVDLDESEIGEKLFRQIVDAAGKKVGLGDYRPSTKGPFGRFVVINWAVVEAPIPMPVKKLKAA